MDIQREPLKSAYEIACRLKAKGHVAYFVGGCVRDDQMGKAPQDVDIATTASPEEVESYFSKTIPVGKQFGVILVVAGERAYEVATFRQERGYTDGRHPAEVRFSDPREDALRRDFTVNGLFYDPFEQKVIDYVGGVEDLRRKLIRAIGDPSQRFEEDRLRLLRAVRFASTLGFEIEKKTWKALVEKAPLISSVSPERIREELLKVLTRPGAARGFDLLVASGLMEAILPEVMAMKGVKQPPEFHPEGDVLTHTRLLLEQIEQIPNPSPTLALGALLHDVGKPPTYAVREGRICFYNHAAVGTKMTETIMRRLRFSNQEIATVCSSVANHLKFGDVQKMRPGKLKRFVRRDNFLEELELHRLDCLASHGKLDNYYFLKQKLKEYEKEELKPRPWVNGHDLQRLGMKPGPAMKPILTELYDLQLEGAFKDRKEALERAEQLIRQTGEEKGHSGRTGLKL